MNRQKFNLNGTDLSIGVNDLNQKRVTHSLRLLCNKLKRISIDEVLKIAGVSELRQCNFCGNDIHRYEFKYHINENNLILDGIEYVDDLYYCKVSGCPGKKLNPNSIEFVSKSRKISTKDAINLIHSRNSSPFYAENHSSIESYKNYQNAFYGKTVDEVVDIVLKQNFSRSKEGYIQRYGDNGEDLWKIVQSKKAITVENLSRIYSINVATEICTNWKHKTRNTLDNFIRRYGEPEGRRKYIEYVNRITKNSLNWHGIYGTKCTLDQITFYSKMELEFYRQLRNHGFDEDVLHDQNYPDSILRSDFYFPKIDAHLEIAGMGIEHTDYWKKIAFKKEKFNAIIVSSVKDYDIIIKQIIERHKDVNEH